MRLYCFSISSHACRYNVCPTAYNWPLLMRGDLRNTATRVSRTVNMYNHTNIRLIMMATSLHSSILTSASSFLNMLSVSIFMLVGSFPEVSRTVTETSSVFCQFKHHKEFFILRSVRKHKVSKISLQKLNEHTKYIVIKYR